MITVKLKDEMGEYVELILLWWETNNTMLKWHSSNQEI